MPHDVMNEMVTLVYLDLRGTGRTTTREVLPRREALKARADLRSNGYAAWFSGGAPLPVDTFMRLNERHG